MKHKILMLIVAAMMIVGSALPALAQPADPDCGWYRDNYFYRLTGQEWYGYWCYWGEDDGWMLYSWWNEDEGYFFL